VTDRACEGCGGPLDGRRRVWCSDACRERVALSAREGDLGLTGRKVVVERLCQGCSAPLERRQRRWCRDCSDANKDAWLRRREAITTAQINRESGIKVRRQETPDRQLLLPLLLPLGDTPQLSLLPLIYKSK
jgi:hypothetical protein